MILYQSILYLTLVISLFVKAGWSAPVAPHDTIKNEHPQEKLIRQEDFLNQILSTDSDEDVFFGWTWSDLFLDDEDDESMVVVASSRVPDPDDTETGDENEQMIVITHIKQSFKSDQDEELDYFSDT